MSSGKIYDIARDSIVILTVLNNTFTGWVHQVKNKRIFVICCAHSLLQNSGTTFPVVPISNMILGNVTNAIRSGKEEKNNISVTFGILGMNISADIAVLFSYTEEEANNENGIFGFNFSSKTKFLKFGDENLITPGTKLYCINDSFGSPDVGLSIGYINQTAVIFSPGPNYTNNTGTIISNLTVAPGASGSPILVLMDNKIRVIGMVNWQNSTNPGFIGGASQSLLENSYNEIAKLNNIFFQDHTCNNIILPYVFVNFTGETGKGFLGVGGFVPVQDTTLVYLNTTYPAFAASKYSNLSDGVLIKNFSSFPIVPPGTGISNATDCEGNTVQPDDIILSINGVKVGYTNRNIVIQSAIYFNAGGIVKLKILRPSTIQKLKFDVVISQYPPELEYVSTDPTITLLSDSVTSGSLHLKCLSVSNPNTGLRADGAGSYYFKSGIDTPIQLNGTLNWNTPLYIIYIEPSLAAGFPDTTFYLNISGDGTNTIVFSRTPLLVTLVPFINNVFNTTDQGPILQNIGLSFGIALYGGNRYINKIFTSQNYFQSDPTITNKFLFSLTL